MAESRNGRWVRIAAWFDARLGLTYPLLRPAPIYSINPFYWLGALTVVAFLIQGVTGVMMMLYYTPSPTDAFSSTQYIFQSVYYGRFLQTVHLYTAYAMIMLAFMHMMRGYFVSVYKKPREMMWVVGMVMGFVTLGFGFTGYLLPWTVVSKSATDVGIGIIDALPGTISSFLSFLIVGAGGDATELLRFYDLHVVVLPAVLLVLLTLKMYMLEAHGIAEPSRGPPIDPKASHSLPIFPDVTFYLLELAALFGSAMLLISAIFPLSLPPEYSPQLAAQFTPQPDWYFLWIYQILKISAFEGSGLSVAIGLVTVLFVVLIALPLIDRGSSRRIAERPVFVTVGLIFIAELFVLAYWGLESPGQVIATDEAVLVLGAIALLVGTSSFALYTVMGARGAPKPHSERVSRTQGRFKTALAFVLLLSGGALAIGASLNAMVHVVMYGMSSSSLVQLGLSTAFLSIVIFSTIFFMYRIELAGSSLKKRFDWLEIGRSTNDSH
ncbi:MAG: cytochrome bc complex cytochrome b subunit [Candidatus Bathyarchaeia archaeon]